MYSFSCPPQVRRKSIPAACVTSTNNGGFVAGVFTPGSCAAFAGFATGPLFVGAEFFGAAVCAVPHEIQPPFNAVSRPAAATVMRRFLMIAIAEPLSLIAPGGHSCRGRLRLLEFLEALSFAKHFFTLAKF